MSKPDFIATHSIVIRRSGIVETIPVHVEDNCAFTVTEWAAESSADWELVHVENDATLLFQGQVPICEWYAIRPADGPRWAVLDIRGEHAHGTVLSLHDTRDEARAECDRVAEEQQLEGIIYNEPPQHAYEWNVGDRVPVFPMDRLERLL